MTGDASYVIKDFAVVKRIRRTVPAWNLRGRYRYVRQAVLETLGTDNEVKVALRGEPVERLREGLRRAINRKGLRLRSRHEGDFLFAWVEEMPNEYLEREMREEGA